MAIKIKGNEVITDTEDLTIAGSATIGDDVLIHGNIIDFEEIAEGFTSSVMIRIKRSMYDPEEEGYRPIINAPPADGWGKYNLELSSMAFHKVSMRGSEKGVINAPNIELNGNVDVAGSLEVEGAATIDGNLTVPTVNGESVPIYRSGSVSDVNNGGSATISYGVTFTEVPLIVVYIVPESSGSGGGPNPCGHYTGDVGTCGQGRDDLGGNIKYGYHIYEATTTGFKIKNDNASYDMGFQWRAIGIKA